MENTKNTQLTTFKIQLVNTLIYTIFNKDGSIKNQKLYDKMGEIMNLKSLN